jgi:DNA-binding response OmpR family regulator
MSNDRILLVDDDEMIHLIVEEYLADFGYQIYKAKNSREGLEMIPKVKPDLILLDIGLPGQDGFQTLEEIKRTPVFSKIPVLFLTSYDRSSLKVKGLELGADDYITKPFDKAELLARIKVSLRRTERYLKGERTVEGNLSDISLTELLQTIELGNKTATVTLPDLDGEIGIEEGLFVFCRQGRFTGEDAINRIFLLEEGKFTLNFGQIPGNIIKQQPVQVLKMMMHTVAYIDKLKMLMKSLPHLESRIQITKEIRELKGGKELKGKSAISIKNLVVLLEGDLIEIVKSLIRLNQDIPFQVEAY